jgi:uncharacterized protein (DUF2336 family)
MSQFAAHDEADGPGLSRTAELTPTQGTPHRGTAQGFRQLRQRLKGRPSSAGPAPPPQAEASVPPITLEIPQALHHPGEPEPVPAEPEEQGLADLQAFDLASLFGNDQPAPMVELSGMDKLPSGRLLLEGTVSSDTLVEDSGKDLAQPREAGGPAAATSAELKQLRLPKLPSVDEFALLDDEPPGRPSEPAEPPPANLPELAHAEPASPEPAFWQKGEARTDAPVEIAITMPPVNIESEEAGDVARSLLEIMSLPANATQPQERALAADSLLHLLDRLPLKTLIAMVERLSLMESPPPLILAELIHDARIEVAGPLLEKCPAIDDQDLLAVIADGRQHSNRMIARRRSLPTVVCDALIASEDVSAILTLVRNPGAAISHEAFFKLNDIARLHPTLQAPLATRADLPAPVAFELFWVLPAELRRYVISRFLTDSATLNKILKLTMRMEEQVSSPRFASAEEIERLFPLLLAEDRTPATELMSALLGLAAQTAERILSDRHGEPLAVACKALGASRADFERLLLGLTEAPPSAPRLAGDASGLQSFFETLSFNKARVLLTYWDWAILRSGPYAGL